ncbi:MAG: HAD family phosphatase [Anaerolineae bacterium]
MLIEAVIFDMEGVLMDSEGYWTIAREGFARDIGKTWTMEDQRAAMGRNTVEWARVMQQRLHLDMTEDAIIDDVIRRVLEQYDERLPVRAGAMEAVRRMAGHYKVALASGSPTRVIDYSMQHTGLDRVFQAIVYGDTISNGKPAPDIYIEALRRLGVNAENAVGIEDSSNGVRALHNAGMHVIAAPSEGFGLPPDVVALADRVIDHLDEVTEEMVGGLAG